MKDNETSAQTVFEEALRIQSVTDRNAFLDSACKGNDALRQRVDLLLEGHFNAAGFLNTVPDQSEIKTPNLREGIGTKIGKFKILEKIGEGGFGVVYMAEQKEPVRRRVALKIIKLGMDTQQVVARFEAERQALAMMDHPNIARVLDGGTTEPHQSIQSNIQNQESDIPSGRPYFVMELVKGRPITRFCDEERLTTKQRLELFIYVCNAVQHAHQKGVVHRDLKPSNVLVNFTDGKPTPKIIDFGIAKAMQHDLTDKTVFTRFHQFMGTPAYMSPEQAGTDSADVDTRSDIYSLGVLLYELLTGKTPLEAKELNSGDYDEIRRRIREIEPPRPSNRLSTLANDELTTLAKSRAIEPAKLTKLIRGELDWVVLKAMEKDRSRRYETANEFAKDIRRYLDNEPVAAVRPSPVYHLQKFVRRHKAALATAASFVLLLTVSACVSTTQAIKNRSLFTAAEESRLMELSAKEREVELRHNVEAERNRSQRLLYAAHMNLAQRAWDEAKVGRALELLDMHRPQPGQPDLRNFEWYYLERLCHKDLLTLKGHTNTVWNVAFSPDGKRLASAGGRYSAPNNPGELKVWDTGTGQEALTLVGHTNAVWCVAFSQDGKRLASGGGLFFKPSGELKLWDAMTGQATLTLTGHTRGVVSVAFNPDGKRLASGSLDNTVKVWDLSSGRELLTLQGFTSPAVSAERTVVFSPDGRRLAFGSQQTVKVFDAASGQELLDLKGHSNLVTRVAFDPSGKRLASASFDETAKVWDLKSGLEILTLGGHTAPVFSVTFSAGGKWLASAGGDQTIKVWNVTNGRAIRTFKGHTGPITSVEFSSNGNQLVSASRDQTIKIWETETNQESLTLSGHTQGALSVAFSPDGKRLASASEDTTVKVWDATNGQETLTLKGHSNVVASVAFSPDGKRLASAGGANIYNDQNNPGELKIWNLTTGHELLALKGHNRGILEVAFSRDGRLLASASWDQTVKIWSADTGIELLTLNGHTNGVAGISFSPDGNRIASASYDHTVKLWEVSTGHEMLTLRGHTAGVSSVAFSPGGKRLASASWDTTVKVWNSITGQETLTLRGHVGPVFGVVFSPDGKRLASASNDQTVKVWDLTSGQETLTLKGHTDEVLSLACSPDGKQLASTSWDGIVRLWDAEPRSEKETPTWNMR